MCRLPVAGVVYQILHYMLGLERLGYEVYYVEWHGNWVEDPMVSMADPKAPRLIIADVMRTYGFGDRWICRGDQVAPGHTFGGLSPQRLSKVCREAEAVINVTGAHFMEDMLLQCPRRVYIESDPGIPQIKWQKGDQKMHALIAGHTHLFTFGENIHGKDCLLPAQELNYLTTRQPVVLDLWNNSFALGQSFTTVARWRKPKDKRIEFNGECYRWNKNVEFEKFIDLPKQSNQSLELALSEVDDKEKQELQTLGWNVIDAVPLSASLEDYRSYIQHSRGEFTIAKDQYVRLRTGWFSDRSACYLAAGRPVVTQDTGFGRAFPTGEGLFAFQTPQDALNAIDAINSDYKRHSEAARDIAREYFDATEILKDMLESIGLDYGMEKRMCVHEH